MSKVDAKTLDKLSKAVDALVNLKKNTPEKEYDNMARWIQKNLWIKPKGGGLQRFILNRFQKRLLAALVKNFKQKKPVRFIVLKSRQVGISTLVEAFMFYLLTKYPSTTGLVLAHRNDSTRNVFTIARRFWQNLSKEEKIPLEGGRPAKDHIEFMPPHSSAFWVMTAGGDEIGRSWTLNFVHCSEMAFFPNPELTLTSLNQAVPKPSETWFSMYVIESTANGLNLFKTYWDLAKTEESDWEGFFFSWVDDPACSLELPPGQELKKSKTEIEFQLKHKWTDGQLLWARKTCQDQCHGSWPKFFQEYPPDEHTAFISTGFNVFDPETIGNMKDVAAKTPSIFTGEIKFLSATEPYPKLVESPMGSLTIWEKPDTNEEYVLGVDCSEGIGADYSEIVVLSTRKVKVVAHYRNNRIKPQDFGIVCWLLGAHYYYGLLGVERNAVGLVILAVVEHGHGDRQKYPQLRRYPNLYYETPLDKKTVEEGNRLGFNTSRTSKKNAIVRLGELISDRDIEIYSIPLLTQLEGLIWSPKDDNYMQENKDPVSELYNDDGVMSLSIANAMRAYNFGRGFCPKPTREDF